MNTAQKTRIMEKIAGLAYDTRRESYFKWLDVRQTYQSGVMGDDDMDGAILANGDGVFWSWQSNEGRVFIKAPVAVLDALEKEAV